MTGARTAADPIRLLFFPVIGMMPTIQRDPLGAMHLSNKLWLYRMGLIGSAITALVLVTLFWAGISTLYDAQHWSDHASQVLDKISAADAAITNADIAGRNPLATPESRLQIETLRSTAVHEVETIKPLVADNPDQIRRCDELKQAVDDRFNAQDQQIATITSTPTSNGTHLTFRTDVMQTAIAASKSVEAALAAMRATELDLLAKRDDTRYALQFKLVVWAAISEALMFVMMMMSIFSIISELKMQRRLVFTLKDKMHETGADQSASLSQDEILELIAVLDRGVAGQATFRALCL